MSSRDMLGFVVALSLVLGGAGCSTSIGVDRVRIGSAGEVSGLAVNDAVPHRVVAFFPAAPGGNAMAALRVQAQLPSAETIYVIDYRGALFFENKLAVDLHEDGTIKRVRATSESQAEEDLGRLNEAIQINQAAIRALQGAAP